jgi:Uma2 family endonuclease
LITKLGRDPAIYFSLHALRRLLDEVFTPRHVYTEIPIDVAAADNPTNEPEPDLVVLKEEIRDFASNPQPSQIELVVEVGDSSLRFDLTVKADLYARAGLAEYWVLDINNRGLVAHRNPDAGRYTSIVFFREAESMSPLARPEAALAVGDMLLPLR